MRRRAFLCMAVLVGLLTIGVVLKPSPNHTKKANDKQQSIVTTGASSQAEDSIFSILGSVSPALAPSVTTDAATNIAFDTATLNGTVLTAGSSPITTRGFEYGLTNSYGDTTTENVPEALDYVLQWGDNIYADGELQRPHDTAVDASGNVYVLDTYNHRVQKFNSSSVYQSQFGSNGSGNGQFSNPLGIAVDASGNIYVTDTGNSRVQKFNSSGVYQSQFGSYGNGNGQFSGPQGIILDTSGNIYVADVANDRIQKFNSSGVYQSQFGTLGSGNGQFNGPGDVTIDTSGNIYVADTYNHRIQKFNSSGVYQSKFGTVGSGNGQFISPEGITIDSSGNIYVADTNNNRIQKFNSSGVYQSQFGSYGNGNGQFAYPQGITIDSSGNIYVADSPNNRIQKFNSSGAYIAQSGDNPARTGKLSSPYGTAVDSSGNIYVADTGHNRIQKFNSSGAYQSQFGTFGSGNGQFSNPLGIALDTAGNIYVADTTNHRIQKFNSSGVYQSQFGSYGTAGGQFSSPQDIGIDSSDNIYVVDNGNNRIQKFNSSGVYQSQFGSYGTADGQFSSPQDIGIDSSDNIYVVDNGNNRIQKFNSSGVYQSQFGSYGNSNGELGAPSGITLDTSGNIYVADTTNHRIQKFNSSGIYQAQFGGYGNGNGQFIYPQGIAVDTSGNIYVADTTNHRIQKLAEDMHEGVFSTDLNGLICNTTYHYRAYATNSEDTIWGNDATFTTAACPYPDPPTNLQATILSATTISFSWDAPTNTGDSLIDHYNFGYRKVGDNNWLTGSTDDDETTTTIPGLMPSTQYEFGVSAVNANGYDDDTLVTITATTGTPGFYLINNCQQLQDINNDLSSSYELARNIDCSDTVNWNGGAGFAPIGNPLGSTFFTGLLAGNNYSISDLYINQSGGQHAFVAPFGATMNAIFQDVRIVQPVIHGSSSGTTYVSGLAVLMVGDDAASSVTNVHIVDAELYGERVETGSPPDNEDGVVIGGLASVLNVDEVPAAHSRNEFRGTIHASGSMPSVFSGGLYGLAYGNSTIDDSYANAASNITNTLTGSDHNSFIGGLIGEASGAVNINHSYAAGSIAVNDTEPAAVSMIGGLAGDLAGGMASNSFARVSMSNSVPGVQQATGGFIGGWIDSIAPTSVNNFFDADVAGTTDCSSPLLDPLPGCTAISGQPNYFYNNTTNAPLNTWDFTNVWSTTSTLPVFDKKVLTSITAIPPSRLPGYVPPAGTVLPRASEQPTLGPVVPPKLSIRSFGEELLPPAENPPTSLIERLKQFFRNVPEVVLVSFPYAFFSLLLIGALALLIEVGLQARRLQATKLLLARQAAVAKERDTFWHLAANYLRAPITLMIGGVELLSDDKTPGIAKLQTLSKQLQTKVGVIMERIEQSKSLQGIMRPKVEAPRRVLGLLRFWVPVVAVGVLAVTINIVATSYRNINLSLINLGMQVMVFVIASLVLYWVLGALGVVSSKRKKAEAMLARQAASLDSARSEFIAQAAEDLDTDLTGLKNELDRLGNKAAATAIVYEGAHRLRELIDSFQLLVAAQNNKLGELSPKTAHANLDGIVDETLRSLSSVIAQKQLTVHKAELSGMIVPGNTLLVNQVVGSVLSNAVAFSPAKSTIELSLKQDKGSVRLVVTNQGTPIPSDELSHVFSPLTKADGYDGLQLDHDGLGVNLYIDKLIMKHLGGEIAVASSTAKGTTMVMKWPTVAVG